MQKSKTYDIVFLGLGVSTILHYLIFKKNYQNLKICFIEARKEFDLNKTISGFVKDIDLPLLKKFKKFECKFGKEKKLYTSNTRYVVLDLKKIFNNFLSQAFGCDFKYNSPGT